MKHSTHMDTFMKTYIEKIKNRKEEHLGRILFYCNKELKYILTFLEKSSEYILWVKVAKGFLHADREVYLAGVYNSLKQEKKGNN